MNGRGQQSRAASASAGAAQSEGVEMGGLKECCCVAMRYEVKLRSGSRYVDSNSSSRR